MPNSPIVDHIKNVRLHVSSETGAQRTKSLTMCLRASQDHIRAVFLILRTLRMVSNRPQGQYNPQTKQAGKGKRKIMGEAINDF